MPDNLSITWTDIRIAIAREFGLGEEDPDTEWNTLDARRVADWIKSGLHRFYSPAPLPEERTAHVWSFLTPEFFIQLSQGVRSYSLPADFGGLTTTKLWFARDDDAWRPLELCSLAEIHADENLDVTLVSAGPPLKAYIGPVKSDGTFPQKQGLIVWPVPDGSYTAKATYFSNPYQIGEDTPYPLGGQPAADAVLESCLAVAEATLRPEMTIHRTMFVDRLRAAIAHDRQLIQRTRRLGRNSDPGRAPHPNRRTFTGLVTYNGQEYPGVSQ